MWPSCKGSRVQLVPGQQLPCLSASLHATSTHCALRCLYRCTTVDGGFRTVKRRTTANLVRLLHRSLLDPPQAEQKILAAGYNKGELPPLPPAPHASLAPGWGGMRHHTVHLSGCPLHRAALALVTAVWCHKLIT